tara:strand:- start:5961 stop:6113 length:153 start_codon:yes stop_codon:yes gene_type:complete
MPELDGKKYKYDSKGKAQYAKDLVKKLKKKRKKVSYESGDNQTDALSSEG